jgi:hypothetical protein
MSPKSNGCTIPCGYNRVPLNTAFATLKSMINPVTSTSVATNGADALAGSTPARLRMNGSIEPATVPNVTTPTKLKKIVAATRMYYSP